MSFSRYLFVPVLMLLATGAVHAQEEETLLGGGFESGGYGAPVVKFTTFKGEFAVMVGGYGGWLINHAFMLGGGGYGLVTHHSVSEGNFTSSYPDLNRIEFGYGGGMLEYIFAPKSVVHSTVSLLIGGGAVTLMESWSDPESWMHGYQADAVFVLEPSVNIELNVTSFFRVNAGGSYRFVNGVSMYGLTNKDLSGGSVNLALKFGGF